MSRKTRSFAVRFRARSAKTVGPRTPGGALPFGIASAGNVSKETRHVPGIQGSRGRPPALASDRRPMSLPPEPPSASPVTRPRAGSLTHKRVHGRDISRRAPSNDPTENTSGGASCASAHTSHRIRHDVHGGMVSPSTSDGLPGTPPMFGCAIGAKPAKSLHHNRGHTHQNPSAALRVSSSMCHFE